MKFFFDSKTISEVYRGQMRHPAKSNPQKFLIAGSLAFFIVRHLHSCLLLKIIPLSEAAVIA